MNGNCVIPTHTVGLASSGNSSKIPPLENVFSSQLNINSYVFAYKEYISAVGYASK